MEKIRANEDNDLKYRQDLEKSILVRYKKDSSGNIILDENGNPIVESQNSGNNIQYFTE